MDTKPTKQSQGNRSAYILVLVLGMTAVVTSLGLAYLEAHSTVMPEAVNRYGSVRAQYLAESGVDTAKHFLMYPPNGTAVGAYFTGVNGLGVDASADYVNISTSQDVTDPYIYDIKAVGVAKNEDGTQRGKYGIACKVLLPEDPTVKIPCGLVGISRLYLPPALTINGKVHSNADIASYAYCTSVVSAAGWIWWPGGGSPTLVMNTPTYSPPSKDPQKYKEYQLHGQRYQAYTGWTNRDLYQNDAKSLNNMDWSATNPGRMVFVDGDLDLHDSVNFSGTFLVTGKVRIEGWNVRITAEPGFPALVVGGEIDYTDRWMSLETTGSVMCTQIDGNNNNNIFLSIEGACMVTSSDGLEDCWDAHTFNITYDAERATIIDVLATEFEQPITVLEWEENG